jgi:hypothetical protein
MKKASRAARGFFDLSGWSATTTSNPEEEVTHARE